MNKIIFLVCCLFAPLRGSLLSTEIECDYRVSRYVILGRIYGCFVNNNPNILTEESAQISEIIGTHEISRSNDDVVSIEAYGKTIQFFPKNMEKFLKNLKLIWIRSCELKELHQTDLKKFPNLVFFYVSYNEIEVVEEGLFDFNPNLELVGIEESKLIHIDPNVLDHLTKLSYFWFENVPCIKKDVRDSKERVQAAIKVLKSNCSSSEFLSFDSQIKNLENDSKFLSSEAFNTKLESLEKNFKNSKFSKFRPLDYKIENLKNNKCSNCHQLVKPESLNTQIIDLFENMNNQIEINFEDLKSSQSADFFTISLKLGELKVFQNELKNLLNETVKSSGAALQILQGEAIKFYKELKSSQDQIQSSINRAHSFQNILSTKVDKILSSQVSTTLGYTVQSSLTELLNHIIEQEDKHDSEAKIFYNETHVSFESIKSEQIDHRDILDDIKLFQEFINSSINAFKDSFELSRENLNFSLNEITGNINEHKNESKIYQSEIQTSLKSIQDQIKFTGTATAVSIDGLNSIVGQIRITTMQLSFSLNGIVNSIGSIKVGIKEINATLDTVKSTQESQNTTLFMIHENVGNLTTELNDHKEQSQNNTITILHEIKLSENNTLSSLTEKIESVSLVQNDTREAINEISASQNDTKITLTNFNISLSEIAENIKEHKEESKIDQNEVKSTLSAVQAQITSFETVTASSFVGLTTQVGALQVTATGISGAVDLVGIAIAAVKLSQGSIESSIDNHREDFRLSQIKLVEFLNEIMEKADAHDNESRIFYNEVQVSFKSIQSEQTDQGDRLGILKLSQESISSSLNDFKDNFDSSQKNLNLSLSKITENIDEHKTESQINQNEVRGSLKSIQDQIKSSQNTTTLYFNELNSKVDELLNANINQSSTQNDTLNAIEILTIKVDDIQQKQKSFENSLNSIKATQTELKSSQDALQSSLNDLKAKFDDHKDFTESSISTILKVLKEIQISIGN